MDACDPCKDARMGARETHAGEVHETRERWDTIYPYSGKISDLRT